MKFGVVVFPGSNCDADCFHVLKEVVKCEVDYIWHKDKKNLAEYDCLVLPGGFSYGDYLRTGAIARFSPVMENIINFANNGGLVLGICNGFQILTESGLLPGALVRNKNLKFVCKDVDLIVENNETAFSNAYDKKQVIRIPVAHGEGSYVCTEEILHELERDKRIIFRYATAEGEVLDRCNFNGSLNNIAGIINKQGNVLGMMPHPERCAEPVLGNEIGRGVFDSIITWLQGGKKVG